MNEFLTMVAAGAVGSIATLLGRDAYERAKVVVVRGIARRRPDHLAIEEGLDVHGGPNNHLWITLKCAPSKSGRSASIAYDKTVEFVKHAYADYFRSEAEFSSREGMRFAWAGTDPDLASTCTLGVWRTGRIELRLPLPHSLASDGHLETPLLGISTHIDYFIRSVTAHYRAIYGTVTRIDWYVNLSGGVMVDGVWRHWRPTFLTAEPGGRAAGTHPGQQLGGYARAELRARKLGTPSRELTEAVIVDLLTSSGYRVFDETVAEILENS